MFDYGRARAFRGGATPFGWLDKHHEKTAAFASARSTARKRVLPEVPIISKHRTLPQNIPIDYFNPAIYKRMRRVDRRKYADMTIVSFAPKLGDILESPK